MIKILLSACIDAPKEKVWSVLSSVEQIDLWVDSITAAYCEGSQSKGVGTIRVCKLKGNISVKEKWLAWDEGNSFTYQGYNIPMVKTAKNTWSVKSVNGKTLISTYSEVELKGGIFGKLLEPLMQLLSMRMGKESLASLNYLVETGKPFKDKLSKLPKLPVAC